MALKAIKILWHFKEFIISSCFFCRRSEWNQHKNCTHGLNGLATCSLAPQRTTWRKKVSLESKRILLSTELKSSHCNLTIDDRMHFAPRQRRRSPASAVFVIIEIDIISRSNENTQERRRRKKLFNKKRTIFEADLPKHMATHHHVHPASGRFLFVVTL